MSPLRRILALMLCAVLLTGLWGCELPRPGFTDFDVSGYIDALLDSSYQADHTAIMEISALTEEDAQGNNTATVENAAIRFCNLYSVMPNEGQLIRIEHAFSQVLANVRYSVSDEVRTSAGYNVDVKVYSIVNFADCGAEIEALRQAAEEEARQQVEDTWKRQEQDNEALYDLDDEWSGGDDDDGYAPEPEPEPDKVEVDYTEKFAEKVVEFCERQLMNLSYDTEQRTVTLNILQTEKGELQLDMNQIDTIDQTVVLFTK